MTGHNILLLPNIKQYTIKTHNQKCDVDSEALMNLYVLRIAHSGACWFILQHTAYREHSFQPLLFIFFHH